MVRRPFAALRATAACFFALVAVLLVPTAARADYAGFRDVGRQDWYVTEGYLDYALEEGLLKGYGDTFGPGGSVIRADVATVLWRVAGEPDAGLPSFSDVSSDMYYAEAVEWARSKGIVTGYSETEFLPERAVSREELATMMHRYATNVAGLDASSDCAGLDAIEGAGDVSSYAREAMGWAVDEGIISGKVVDGITVVDPQGTAVRAEMAKMASIFHAEVLGLGEVAPPEGSDPIDGVDFASGVTYIEMEEYELSGEYSATIDSSVGDVSVGDIVVLAPTDENPGGAAIKVTRVSATGEGVSVVGVEPELDEVVDELDVTGTTAELVSVELADGVELVDDDTGAVVPMVEGAIDLVDKTFKIKGVGNVKVESSLDFDIDYAWGKFDLIELTLNADARFDTSLKATTGDRSIKLGTLSFKTGVPGLTVDLDFYFTYSASGGMELWATASASAGARYEDGDWSTSAEKVFEYGVGITGEARAGLEPALVLEFLSIDLVDASAEVGGVISGHTQIRDTGMICNDLSAWMYVDLAIGQHDSALDKLGIGKVFHIVTEKNSPRWDQHSEDGKVVPECTWGKESEDVDDSEEPSDDTEIPDGDGKGVFQALAVDEKFFYGGGTTTVTLSVNADGTFSGGHYFSNASESDPDGGYRVETGDFTGRFSNPVKVSEHGYSVTVEELTVEDEGKSYINDYGWMEIITTPRCLAKGTVYTIYFPGTPAAELPLDNNASTLPYADSIFDAETGALLCNYFWSPVIPDPYMDPDYPGVGTGFYPYRLLAEFNRWI